MWLRKFIAILVTVSLASNCAFAVGPDADYLDPTEDLGLSADEYEQDDKGNITLKLPNVSESEKRARTIFASTSAAAVAAFGTLLPVGCPGALTSTSGGLYMAGAAVMTVGEIALMFTTKNAAKEVTVDLAKNQDGRNQQADAFELARKMTKRAHTHASARAILYGAASVLFIAASVAAGLEAWPVSGQAVSPIPCVPVSAITGAKGPFQITQVTEGPDYFNLRLLEQNMASARDDAEAAIHFQELLNWRTSQKRFHSTTLKEYGQYRQAMVTDSNGLGPILKGLAKFISMGTAHAEDLKQDGTEAANKLGAGLKGTIGGAAGVTAAAMMATAKMRNYAIRRAFAPLFGTAAGRFAVSLVSSAFVLTAMGLVAHAAVVLKKRADLYDKLAKKLRTDLQDGQAIEDCSSPGKAGSAECVSSNPDGPVDEGGYAPGGDAPEGSYGCVTGDLGAGVATADSGCDCKKNDSCAKFPDMQFPKNSFGNDFPTQFADALSGVTKAGDSLSSGNVAGGLAQLGGLGKNQAFLKKKLKQVVGNAKGKGMGNFSAGLGGMVNDHFGEFKKHLAGMTPQEQNALAQAAGAPLLDEKEAKELEKLPEEVKNSVIGQAADANKMDFGLDFDNKKSRSPASAGEKVDQGKALEKFNVNNGDVHQNKGASIFKILELRYKQSAMPRLFEKKK